MFKVFFAILLAAMGVAQVTHVPAFHSFHFPILTRQLHSKAKETCETPKWGPVASGEMNFKDTLKVVFALLIAAMGIAQVTHVPAFPFNLFSHINETLLFKSKR